MAKDNHVYDAEIIDDGRGCKKDRPVDKNGQELSTVQRLGRAAFKGLWGAINNELKDKKWL